MSDATTQLVTTTTIIAAATTTTTTATNAANAANIAKSMFISIFTITANDANAATTDDATTST